MPANSLSSATMCRTPMSRYPLSVSTAALRDATASSEFLESIRAAKAAFDHPRWRSMVHAGLDRLCCFDIFLSIHLIAWSLSLVVCLFSLWQTEEERSELERNGTHAEDWDRVKVADGFVPSTVRNCGLYGNVRLGVFCEKIKVANKTTVLPSGVYNSDLCNVVVEDNALVSRTSLVSNVFVGQRACIFGCGEVTCSGIIKRFWFGLFLSFF